MISSKEVIEAESIDVFSHSEILRQIHSHHPNREEIKKMRLHQPDSAADITRLWKTDSRWKGITRPYAAKDVVRLRGMLHIEYTLARLGAEHLWNLLNSEKYVNALGAVSGNQAVQMVAAGLKAIYVSGWQVAADANSAHLLTADIDPHDRTFLTGERTEEGFYGIRGGVDSAIARGLAYAPYSDMIWCETSEPNLKEAERFADAIHAKFPGKMLAYNCSPSFNWKKKLDEATIARFQPALAEMGYKFQFVTLAGFHVLNFSMFELAREYKDTGMTAYSRVQEKEFACEFRHGYSAVKHQRFVGTGYFDEVAQVIASGRSSLSALEHSTETEQFAEIKVPAQMIEVGQDSSCRPILGERPLSFGHELEHVRSGNKD